MIPNAGPLFEGWAETPVWSVLEGCLGRMLALSESPKAALCDIGDFLFLAGPPQEAYPLLESWAQEQSVCKILIPRDPACGAVIESVFGPRARRGERYAFRKDTVFDRARLAAVRPPDGVDIVPFDGPLYREALKHSWSRDFVRLFDGETDYLRRGLGFAALHSGELIGGASSYTVYHGGIEIQVEVRLDHQRRGIASACCAALILACLNRGLYPSWDAANPASAALAKKLGYRPAYAYPMWEID